MAETNVRIRLTADCSQVRNELRLIDKELADIGNTARQSTSATPSNSSTTPADPNSAASPVPRSANDSTSSTSNSRQAARDKTMKDLVREMILLRREMQQMNQHYSQQSNQPSSGSGSGTPSSPSSPPPPSGGSGSSDKKSSSSDKPEDPRKAFNDHVDKVMNGFARRLTMPYSNIKSWSESDYTRQQMTYKTYGRLSGTGNDYSRLGDSATNLGARWGYDYKTVLPAINENVKQSGWAGKAASDRDMTSILGASRAFGVEANKLAQYSGRMVGLGLSSPGEQQRFIRMWINQTEQNKMEGREGEELEAIESLAETVANKMAAPSKTAMDQHLGMYNTFAAQTPALRGERGASLAEQAANIAKSGNNALDLYAGLGSEFMGLSGKLELHRMAAERPQEYYGRIYKKLLENTGGNEQEAKNRLTAMLHMENGMDILKADELTKAAVKWSRGETYQPIDKETPEDKKSLTGSEKIDQALTDYETSVLSYIDILKLRWRQALDNFGEEFNKILTELLKEINFKDWLPSDVSKAVGATEIAGYAVGGGIAYKALKSLGSAVKGGSAAASSGGILSGLGTGIKTLGSGLAKVIAPIGAVLGGYDTYQSVKEGNYFDAITSGLMTAGSLAAMVPGGQLVGAGLAGVGALGKGAKYLWDNYSLSGRAEAATAPENQELNIPRVQGRLELARLSEQNPSAYYQSLPEQSRLFSLRSSSDEKSERNFRLTTESIRATDENTQALLDGAKKWSEGTDTQTDVSSDIHKQRLEEQAIQKQQKQWTDFFKVLTDQIKNALSSVTGSITSKVKSTGGGGHGGSIDSSSSALKYELA